MSTPSKCLVSVPSVKVDNALLLSVSSLSPHGHSIHSISLPSDLSPGGPSHGPYNGLNFVQDYHKKQMSVHVQGKRSRHATTISMLSDNVLLDIFDFCQKNHDPGPRFEELPGAVWDWHILAHVCRRWRQAVFASPLRLNIRILCKHGTPVWKNLGIWPTFPIHIEYLYPKTIEGADEDSVIAALEHTDRVCAIGLWLTGSQLRKMTTVMQKPFPVLTHLALWMQMLNDARNDVPVLPCKFLGKSAPRLQTISFSGIPFPALPALLLSASDLVTLILYNIPQTGYISPEAMVVALATLTRLEDLRIGFRSPASRPDRIHLPPVTRTVLPALIFFDFHGAREYLENFVALIYAPKLDLISVEYFNQLIDFEVPQLWQFVNFSEGLSQPMRGFVEFQDKLFTFGAGPTTHIHESFDAFPRHILVRILCEGIDWQVSHVGQALNQMSMILSNMLHLAIVSDSISPEPEEMDDIEWLQLLRPFSSVRTLFVSREFAGHLSHALEGIPEMTATEVLPALNMLCLEDQPMSSVHKFITACWDSGRPVTNVNTRSKFEERLMSYQEINPTPSRAGAPVDASSKCTSKCDAHLIL